MMIILILIIIMIIGSQYLDPVIVLLLSVIAAIIGAGFTLSSISPNSGINIFSKHFLIHFVYYVAEVTLRVVVLSTLFYAMDVYGLFLVLVDFLIRLAIGYYIGRNYHYHYYHYHYHYCYYHYH